MSRGVRLLSELYPVRGRHPAGRLAARADLAVFAHLGGKWTIQRLGGSKYSYTTPDGGKLTSAPNAQRHHATAVLARVRVASPRKARAADALLSIWQGV